MRSVPWGVVVLRLGDSLTPSQTVKADVASSSLTRLRRARKGTKGQRGTRERPRAASGASLCAGPWGWGIGAIVPFQGCEVMDEW